MKKILFALLLSAGILGYSVAYSQDSTRMDKKGTKAMKKATKGKHHKAIKKAYKMEKKADKDK